jgi:16S rRNA (guanine966-N2)-methyltransferase
MRIIAGTHRGRPLLAPAGQDTRPILDRQKEALFNILQDAFPSDGVWDVFAGSGALGFEALSRGAAHGTFVERGRDAFEVLRRNVESLGFSDRVTLLRGSAFDLDPARFPPADLLFLDPPFPLYDEDPDRVHALLVRLMSSAGFDPGGVAVLRFRTGSVTAPCPSGLEETDRRRFGDSTLVWFRRI